ncbi:unnamed protein product, partial [Effrenium voratum]
SLSRAPRAASAASAWRALAAAVTGPQQAWLLRRALVAAAGDFGLARDLATAVADWLASPEERPLLLAGFGRQEPVALLRQVLGMLACKAPLAVELPTAAAADHLKQLDFVGKRLLQAPDLLRLSPAGLTACAVLPSCAQGATQCLKLKLPPSSAASAPRGAPPPSAPPRKRPMVFVEET